MFDQKEFRLKLIKPMLVFIVIEVLLAVLTIGIVFWRSTHGRPQWASDIGLWDSFASMSLVVGWFIYIQKRRHKALSKQN